MSQLREQLINEGFSPDFVPENTHGKFKQYIDENLGKMGYLYEEVEAGSGLIKRLTYKIWATSDEYKVITEYPEGAKSNDIKKWKSKFDHDRAKIRELLDAIHGRAAIDAQEYFDTCLQPTSPPQYLREKGLSILSGYRLDPTNPEALVIPLYGRDGKMVSVQTIFQFGEKGFHAGGRISGSYGVIEGSGEVLYICEGFATGASIHLATGGTVAFILSADNYTNGLQSVLARFSHPLRVIGCDDDRHLHDDNKGFNKAFAAASKFNCILKKPAFKTYQEKETTDFDDVRRLYGIEEVTKQLEVTLQEKMELIASEGIYPLGHGDSHYYLTSTQNTSIQCFPTLSKDNLYKLIRQEWWEQRYGEVNQKGGYTVNYESIASKLYAACHEKGPFSPDKIRGVGVYRDAGKIVVHLGDRLLVDGRTEPLRGFKSEYIYQLGKRLQDISSEQTTQEEMDLLWGALGEINIKEANYRYYVAGWLVCALISGALKWRPHLYVMGERGGGKTYFLDFCFHILSRGFFSHYYIAVGSTPTGIRQDCSQDTTSVIIDEVEGDTKIMSDKIEQIFNLYRVASSTSDSKTVVGTPGQKSMQTMVAFCGLMGGIIQQIKTDQDKSRFAVVEFVPTKNPEEQYKKWPELERKLNLCSSEPFARKFAARVITHAEVILHNIEVLTQRLQKVGGARLCQQYGALYAASLFFKHSNKISEEEIEFFTQKMLEKDEAIEESKSDSSVEDILEHILSAEISDGGPGRTTPKRELCKEQSDVGEMVKEVLGEYGVLQMKSDGKNGIHIRPTFKMRQQMQSLPMYSTNFMVALKRYPKSKSGAVARFQGRQYKGLWIPLDSIFTPEEKKISASQQF